MSEPNAASSVWDPPIEDLKRKEKSALMYGVVGLALSGVAWFLDPGEFFLNYLVGWLLWLGVALGCLAVLCLTHLGRGRWGMIIRRTLEAATRTFPLLALLFIPIILGMDHLFSWLDPELIAEDPLIAGKQPYLNRTFFIVRAVLYFAIWTGCAWGLSRMSQRQDRTSDKTLSKKMRTWAAPYLGITALAGTFAAFDWLMSLDPHWFSSIFGVYFLGGSGVSAFAFVILAAAWLAGRPPLDKLFRPTYFHDYGKLLLAFVMLWAYFAFSQYLIIWSAHLPEETVWFLHRTQGGWQWVSGLLIAFHFFLPFTLLLSAARKKDPARLMKVALLLLVVRWIDLYWLAAPTFHHTVFIHWSALTSVVGVGGLWLAYFYRQLGQEPLIPANDHNVQEMLLSD